MSAPGDVLSASGRDARVCGAVQHILCQRYQSAHVKDLKCRARAADDARQGSTYPRRCEYKAASLSTQANESKINQVHDSSVFALPARATLPEVDSTCCKLLQSEKPECCIRGVDHLRVVNPGPFAVFCGNLSQPPQQQSA